MKREFRPFKEAREFVRKLGLKNIGKWRAYCKSNTLPNDITSRPDYIYKQKGWESWGDFLGTGTIASYKIQFCSFKDAREFARSLGIQTWKEWQEYSKSGNKPDDISSNPNRTYKNNGWVTWGDFLGTGTIASQDKVFRPFKEAQEFARSLGLKGVDEWREYCKSNTLPNDITSRPDSSYKNKGWISWGDFFGTERVADMNKQYRPFKEAREFVRTLGIKNYVEWTNYCKSGNKPEDIPANPWRTYKEWNKK